MLIPKMHWLLHFRRHFHRYGVLIACFVTERYHRNPKRFANEMQNTSKQASANILKETVCQMMAKVQDSDAFNFSVGLVRDKTASANVRKAVFFYLNLEDDGSHDVLTAIESRLNRFGTCKKGDVVLIRDSNTLIACKVLLHASIGDLPVTVVSAFTQTSIDLDAGYSEWSCVFNPQLYDTADIVDTVVSCALGEDQTAVLIPCDLRYLL